MKFSAILSLSFVTVFILIPILAKWYQYAIIGPKIPNNLIEASIYEFYFVSGSITPKKETAVLSTSMGCDSAGINSITFLNVSGRYL